MLSSLGTLPVQADISLYIFVINGGWHGGPSDLLEQNFSRLAQEIGPNAVIAKGFDVRAWSSQVAERYLGKNYSDLHSSLPALLLTDTHPEHLRPDSFRLLVPLREAQRRFGDLESFFRSLVGYAQSGDEAFLKRLRGEGTVIDTANDVVDLKPNLFGVGINLNALIDRIRESRKGP
jgi:hypothetical protein